MRLEKTISLRNFTRISEDELISVLREPHIFCWVHGEKRT